MTLALYLRVTHAMSNRPLTRLFRHLFGLQISEGAHDATFRRAKPGLVSEAAAILARLRHARVVCSDETSVRVRWRTQCNLVFQNDQVLIHVVRAIRGAGVAAEVMVGHRPSFWVSDRYGPQQGHTDQWQVCLACQLRDCHFAIEAGDSVFVPRLKRPLLRAAVLARRCKSLAKDTRQTRLRRFDLHLSELLMLPRATSTACGGKNVTEKCETTCSHFSSVPTYRNMTGGFRSAWGAGSLAAVRSVIGTAARRGVDAFHAIRAVTGGGTVSSLG